MEAEWSSDPCHSVEGTYRVQEAAVRVRGVEGFPGYRVTEDGQVQSCWSRGGVPRVMTDVWRTMRVCIGAYGYPILVLCRDGRKINCKLHVLMARAFLGPRPEGGQVRHLDGDKTNCRADNLSYGTHAENMADNVRHGVMARGERHRHAKLTDEEARRVLSLKGSGMTSARVGAMFGMSATGIRGIWNGMTWQHLQSSGPEEKTDDKPDRGGTPVCRPMPPPADGEYRSLPGYPAYRFGADGSAETRWTGVAMYARPDGDWKPLKPNPDRDGYLHVALSDGNGPQVRRKLHQIIAELFLGPRPGKMEVRHLDGDKSNNSYANLAYGTHAQNGADRRRNREGSRGERHPHSRLTEADVREIRRLVAEGVPHKEIAGRFEIHKNYVSRIHRGLAWSHV